MLGKRGNTMVAKKIKRKADINFCIIVDQQFAGPTTYNWQTRDGAMQEFYRLVSVFPDVPIVVLDLATYKVVFDNGVRYAS
jgi:hypothetical protein